MALPVASSSALWGFILGVILVVACQLSFTDAAEKPPSQGLQCDGCVALLQELHPKLSESQGRKRIIDGALKAICNSDNFVVYRHSPPKMIKACNYILDNYKDELAESLHNFYKKYRVKDNLKLQEEFCEGTIKACLPGQRDKDIRMNPVGMSVDEANKKLAEDFSVNQEIASEPGADRDEL